MKHNKQECIHYYEAEAEKYDAMRFSCLCRKLVDTIYKETVYHFIRDADHILDAGTGTGRFAKYFAENGKTVLGLDSSEAMLEETRRKFAESGIDKKITLFQGDIEKIPLEDNTVDAVTCIHVLVHFENPDKAIAELARVLKPGGHLVFELANNYLAKSYNRAWAFLSGKKHYSFTDYYRSQREMEAILEKHNISVVSKKRIKKVPKFILHTLLCTCKLSFLAKPFRWIERLNVGFVSIICGEKKL